MPYTEIQDLPVRVQKLPEHAKEIYLKAFNNAWDEYASAAKRRGHTTREETAHRVAWSAVKKAYQKIKGDWIRK